MKTLKKILLAVAAVMTIAICSVTLTSCDPDDALDYIEDVFDY